MNRRTYVRPYQTFLTYFWTCCWHYIMDRYVASFVLHSSVIPKFVACHSTVHVYTDDCDVCIWWLHNHLQVIRWSVSSSMQGIACTDRIWLHKCTEWHPEEDCFQQTAEGRGSPEEHLPAGRYHSTHWEHCPCMWELCEYSVHHFPCSRKHSRWCPLLDVLPEASEKWMHVTYIRQPLPAHPMNKLPLRHLEAVTSCPASTARARWAWLEGYRW